MRPEAILAFDTSAAHCAAALLLPDGRCLHRHEDMARGQAERLMPLLAELLTEGGIGWRALSALAVGTGPGNFTGVRISVAAARGLALGLGIPAHGVTVFQALRFGQTGPTLIAQDARRGMAYVQMFAPDGPPELVELGELPQDFPAGSAPIVIGDLAPAYAERHGLRLGQPRFALAEAMARCVLSCEGLSPGRPAPFYLRGADAAPPSDPPPVMLDA